MCPHIEEQFLLVEELTLLQGGDDKVELIPMPVAAAAHNGCADYAIVRVESDTVVADIFDGEEELPRLTPLNFFPYQTRIRKRLDN